MALAAAPCFLAALLSKESGVTFLALWFIILIWRGEPRSTVGMWSGIGLLVLAAYCALRFTAGESRAAAWTYPIARGASCSRGSRLR